MANNFLLRECIAILVVGALLAVLMADSIVGMSSGFAPTAAGVRLAGVADHE